MAFSSVAQAVEALVPEFESFPSARTKWVGWRAAGPGTFSARVVIEPVGTGVEQERRSEEGPRYPIVRTPKWEPLPPNGVASASEFQSGGRVRIVVTSEGSLDTNAAECR